MPTKLLTVEHANAGDQIKLAGVTNVHTAKISVKDANLATAISNALKTLDGSKSTANTAYLISTTNDSSTDTGTYLVYTAAASSALKADDLVVKLSGTFTGLEANLTQDGVITLA